MNQKLAKYLSAFGNPILTIPLFSIIALFKTERSQTALFALLLILGGIIIPILVKTYLGVKRGTYTNYDVSNRTQRQSWYVFAAILMLFVTIVLFWTDQSRPLRYSVLFALVLLVASQIVNLYLKTSLHVAFNIFLAFLIMPLQPIIGTVFLLFSIPLAWSRLVLKKHTLEEVISGAILGLATGLSFLWVLGNG